MFREALSMMPVNDSQYIVELGYPKNMSATTWPPLIWKTGLI
jgi:hypothetical protein